LPNSKHLSRLARIRMGDVRKISVFYATKDVTRPLGPRHTTSMPKLVLKLGQWCEGILVFSRVEREEAEKRLYVALIPDICNYPLIWAVRLK
jgi:hypothetical protein